jgi:adenosine deaminase
VDFLEVFDLVAAALIDRDDFSRVAYETLEDGVRLGNLRYREMFFSPTAHYPHGGTPRSSTG